MCFKNYYSNRINQLIEKQNSTNRIFVLLGQTTLVNLEIINAIIADENTFALEGNENIFDDDWYDDIYHTLRKAKNNLLISYAQYSYIEEYRLPDSIRRRILILNDNLRNLFPIYENEFLENTIEQNIDIRPENLPIYQAEQLKINNIYYYSVIKHLDNKVDSVDMFSNTRELRKYSNIIKDEDSTIFPIINFTYDEYALDEFVNNCISNNRFDAKAIVKILKKEKLSESKLTKIKSLNYLLNDFGGELFLLEDEEIQTDFTTRDETLNLLKKYWGDNSSFRNLKIYRNPDLSNDIQEISQGQIVEDVINQYHNAKEFKEYRDIFLTAPTGAGKSLLFQLPSFYISQLGDVTIVISPLIALMNDQVNSIFNDRKFTKVAYLNSDLSLTNRNEVIERCKNKEIDVLYMSPEIFLSYDIKYFINDRHLGLIVIDEAHLITTWGRDFRVDYWYLGNHISKIRKFANYNFPMIAVTATAIYGGEDNMVKDTKESLNMIKPITYIGSVIRDDIDFVISNSEIKDGHYDNKKIEQTGDFIEKISKTSLKTLVYAPFTIHVDKIYTHLLEKGNNCAVKYHASLTSFIRHESYKSFGNGLKKVMISTKAFGMGVDISDIQVVYHHAPSGLLADYIQEIGRVARDSKIRGFAAINYSERDKNFSKILYGISSIKQWELRQVIRKINQIYNSSNKFSSDGKKKRNLLISPDDFGYIFYKTKSLDDLNSKVSTSLMMIEKDYLSKFGYNVFVSRPKKLFVKVFARINNESFAAFNKKYSPYCKLLLKENNFSIIELDLDRIWFKYYGEESFPAIKSNYYKQILFQEEVIPVLKLTYELNKDIDYITKSITSYIQKIIKAISHFDTQNKSYFTYDELIDEFNKYFNKEKSCNIAEFIISHYKPKYLGNYKYDTNGFIQSRTFGDEKKYIIYRNTYREELGNLLKKYSRLTQNPNKENIYYKYSQYMHDNTKQYTILGYLLELFDFGFFEIKGGENPLIFIRINDPKKFEFDSSNQYYENSLLQKTYIKHEVSNRIFDYFFMSKLTNKQRWNFIEDYFLGDDYDNLIRNYPSKSKLNTIDIFDTINKADITTPDSSESANENNSYGMIFHPKNGKSFKNDSLLTLENKTLKIYEWIEKDPVLFDTIRRTYSLNIDKQNYNILESKLKVNHFDYYKKQKGLDITIIYPFKDYNKEEQASILYNNNPVKFYKWWKNNRDKVYLKKVEQIKLFEKVRDVDEDILLRKDLLLIV